MVVERVNWVDPGWIRSNTDCQVSAVWNSATSHYPDECQMVYHPGPWEEPPKTVQKLADGQETVDLCARIQYAQYAVRACSLAILESVSTVNGLLPG